MTAGTVMAIAKKPKLKEQDGLTEKLQAILIGQDKAIETIVPFIQMHQAGLSPEGRPIGVVLLLGPTGTGKTRMVEALAQVLHGNEKHHVRIDCAEFQHSHEICKLLGSPPGYLGHRETHPALSQMVLDQYQTPAVLMNLLLFDEIEKASDALWSLLLGVFDKATLTLGDNQKVNFEHTLIFLTSNLGSTEIQRATGAGFGFERQTRKSPDGTAIERIGKAAARSRFTPEFMNRLDGVVPFQSLNREALRVILEQILLSFSALLWARLKDKSFLLRVSQPAKDLLLDLGTSAEYGARELKRTVQRHFIQPVAAKVSRDEVPAGSIVILDAKDGEFLEIEIGQASSSTRLVA